MNRFFSNIWTKRVASLLGPLYCACILQFAYYSIFYEMYVRSAVQTCLLVSAVSVIALIVMLYSRRQLLTKLTSLVLLPGMLLPILLYFGQWEVLIPPLVVALAIFFFSGLGETAKTVWGTVFLLLYLLGSLVYFLMTSLFAPSTVTTVVQTGNSPSGMYRHTVTETVDSSDGSTKVTVETNALDKDMGLVLFRIKGLSRDVMVERPLNQNITLEWKTESRADITAQISGISDDLTVTLSDAQMDLLGLPAYQVTYEDGRGGMLMQADYHAVVVPLSDADREFFKIDDTELKLDEMSSRALTHMGITVDDLRTMKLSSLSDAQLARLGIPVQGDVLYCNGKVVFRYYIAILEEYFDISKQDLGLT